MNHVKHTIQKLTVDVQTSSVSLGHEIRENARLFIDQQVMPLIEDYLKKLQSELTEEEVLQLNRLTVNISTSPEQWNSDSAVIELRTELDRSLEETTRELQTQRSIQRKVASSKTQQNNYSETVEGVKIKERNQHLLEIWINILETGMGSLRDHARSTTDPKMLEEQLLNWLEAVETEKKKQLSKRLSNHAVQQRLVNQYSPDFIVRMLETVFQHIAPIRSSLSGKQVVLVEISRKLSTSVSRAFWAKMLNFIPFENKSVPTDTVIVAEFFRWLSASSVTNPVIFSDQKERTSLLKQLSLPETSVFHTSKWEGKTEEAAKTIERSLEMAVLAVLTLEWLHQLTGKQVQLNTYSTLLVALLKSVEPNSSKKTAETGVLNTTNDTAVTQELSLETKSEQETSVDKKDASVKEVENATEIEPENSTQRVSESSLPEDPDRVASLETKNGPSSNASEGSGKEQTIDKQQDASDQAQRSDDAKKEPLADQESPVIANDQVSKDTTEITETAESQETKAPAPVSQKSLKEVVSRTLRKLEEEGDFIWVQNAGVILTHPFLKHLFMRIGVLSESNELTDPVLAAHVLHFVATGQESDFEQEMVLEKILCGLAPEDSIPREVPISEEIRKEVDAFFEAIKSNWKPLAGSSNEAMRETFFRREGKLFVDESGLRLIVERKTVDILLNQLSWPVSIVRFAWLKDILYVEW